MKIVMMGTGPFAVPTFEALIASDHEVLALVTRPTKSAPGRKAPPANPMRAVAESRALPVHDPDDHNAPESQATVGQYEADLLVVCDYGQILSTESLQLGRLGGINLHGSLLPKYRGAAPVNWAILNGDAETGITVIHMTPGLDAGPALSLRKTPIARDEDAVQLEHRLAQLGVEAVHEAIALLEVWDGASEIGVRQDRTQATKAPRLKKQDGLIDWTRTAQDIFHQVRGLKPWPGTYTFMPTAKRGPQRVIVDSVAIRNDFVEQPPGTVVHCDGNELCIATKEAAIQIIDVQPAGKRLMQVAEYLRGNPLAVGQTLANS